jgi:hypothetical protein
MSRAGHARVAMAWHGMAWGAWIDEVWVPVREDQVIHSSHPTPQANKPYHISPSVGFFMQFDTYITSSILISFIDLFSLVCLIEGKTYTVVVVVFQHISLKTGQKKQSQQSSRCF